MWAIDSGASVTGQKWCVALLIRGRFPEGDEARERTFREEDSIKRVKRVQTKVLGRPW